ncbi:MULTISPECIES: esterase family protein [unclassified Streptomyces]|uniref:alpha/beta hydrolase n=1 Tax=unclassified Streptomyces TaxID=2593676 RepID=UPI00224FE5D1|nr:MULTISPECIES: alpha/beta hydrolase-fold protein [unclassified Streptomyces]MCX4527848.1 alpha/beta hydrolase-fold protein [Streptomyces sp. NBC_01551]MCX4541555.1 alpha/beta hydrolase-fold protein [Streptomyces sp. NBC_01565]
MHDYPQRPQSDGQDPSEPVRTPRRSRRPIWISTGVVCALVLGGGGFAAWKYEWFSGNGETVSFGKNRPPAEPERQDAPVAPAAPGEPSPAGPTGDPDVLMPAGPKAAFKQTAKLDDGTIIAKTRLAGAKSGFTGDVWVWAPKEYDDPKYAKAAFPVLIALPGGNGYPANYWSDRSLGLQKAITDGVKAGTSLPFIVVMPVLNPDAKYYYDGSDIPGQAKMGTWLSEDIPDFTRANFRTYKSRDGWAFMGSSSGAFVGMKLLLQYPDRFKAVIASGGEIVPDSPLWKGHQAEMDENNPEKLAQKLIDTNGPEVYINFQVGTKESGKQRMTQFKNAYGKGPVKMTIRDIQNGEHNGWHYVRGMKEGSLEWISKVLKAPKPEGTG